MRYSIKSHLYSILFACIFLYPAFSLAVNNRTTYQAKIIKPDGLPLEAVNVSFKFTILDPSASCILYSEEYSVVNMQNTGGLIFFSLGAGNRTYPASGSTTLEHVLDNSVVSFPCQTPGLYTPTTIDNRKIVMQFNDGFGWQTLPAMAINSVPYAMYAGKSDNAVKFNGKSDSAFVEYSALTSLTCNPATEAITFNGATFSCISTTAGGVTSAEVIAALGYTPENSSAVGVSLTTITNSLSTVSSTVYLVSSTVNALSNSVTSLSNSIAVSFSAVTSSQWSDVTSGIGYLSGRVGIGVTDPRAMLDVNGKGWFRSTAGGGLGASAGAGVKIEFSGDAGYIDSYDYASATGKFLYVNSNGANTILNRYSGNVGIGKNNPVTKLDINGGLRISMESASCAVSYAGTIRYNAGDIEFCNGAAWAALGASAVTSSTVVSAFGYTPANVTAVETSFTTITNSLTTVGASFVAVTNSIDAVSSSVITLSASYTNLAGVVSGINSSQWATSGTMISYDSGNVGLGTSAPQTALHIIGKRDVYWSGNSTYRGGGKQHTYNVFGDQYGNGSFYTYGASDTVGGGYWIRAGHAGAYIKGGDGSGLSGGGAGVVAIGGDASGGSASTWGGAGLYAHGGLNGNGARTYAAYFDGGDVVLNQGNMGIATSAPTARLHIAAGTSSTAPMKFSSGTLLSSAQSGALEYDGTNFYLTDSTNTRRTIATATSVGSIDNASTVNATGNMSLVPVGSVIVSSTTASINANTGALVVNGGVGVAGNINVSGTISTNSGINVNASTDLYFQASANFPYDAGDIVFKNADSSERARIHSGQGVSPSLQFSVGSAPTTRMTITSAGVNVTDDLKVNSLTIGRGGGSISGNVALGENALLSNTFGEGNVANGSDALRSNTTGDYNTANGRSALRMNTTGYQNVATGFQALYSNTTGRQNTANGVSALQSNTTGMGNIGVGYNAGSAITTGNYNVVIGSNTGSSISTVSNTVLIADGQGNERIRVESAGNVGIGTTIPTHRLDIAGVTPAARTYAVSGVPVVYLPTQGTAVGQLDGSIAFGNGLRSAINSSSNQGRDNTSVGIGALYANTTGSRNTAIGKDALRTNTTGGYNTATGYNSLYYNTTGGSNVADGHNALFSNTTGSYNLATGYEALNSNTSGNYNTAVGYYALESNTTGTANVAVGTNALRYNATKTESTAIGFYSMSNADSVSAVPTTTYNTAVGAYSLQGSSTPASNTGYRNTALGHSALKTISSGSGNIGIGYNAGSAITTGNYNVVIGGNTGSTIASSSYNIIISDGFGNNRMHVDSTGNVGVGTSTPSAKLDVSGTITMSSSSEGTSAYVVAGASYSIPDTSINIRRLTLNNNATVTLPSYSPSTMKVFTLTVFVKQDGSGARAINFIGAGSDTIKWDSGSAPSISSTPSRITILQFTKPSDETVWYGSKVWQED